MECGCLFLHACPFFLLDHRITICGKMSFQDEYNDLGTEIKCLFLAPQDTPDNNKKILITKRSPHRTAPGLCRRTLTVRER